MDGQAPIATIVVGRAPWRVVVDSHDRRAFVINQGDGSVSVLDSRTGAVLQALTVGTDPVAAAADERTGRLFVANAGDATVSVVDARSGAVVRTVVVGTSPQWLAVDERTGRVFVPNRSDGTVSVLNARSGAVMRTVAVGLFPFAAAVDERTDRVFVRCNSGRVVVLDARNGDVVRTVRVGAAPWGQVAVDQQTARVFVTNPHDKTVSMLDAHTGVVLRTIFIGIEGYRPAVDGRAGQVMIVGPANGQGRAVILSARTGALQGAIALGYTLWPALAVTRTGSVLVGTVGKTDRMGDATDNGAVSVLDPRNAHPTQLVAVGIFPIDIGVDDQTRRAFVVNYTARWSDGSPIAVAPAQGWWTPAQRWLSSWTPLVPTPRPPRPSTNGTVSVLDTSRLGD